jgi:Ser/Thr protein kinase RdoA (MazF antagonist)
VLNQAGIAHTSAQLLWHSPRPLSAAAIIDLNDRRLFVKRHHQSVRTVAQLREEHGFIAHLQSRGAPVSRVIRSADGDSAVACGSWTYEIHADGDGRICIAMRCRGRRSRAAATRRAAGRALASLHEAARTYTAPPRATQLLVSNAALIRAADPLAQLRAMLERRPALRAYLQRHDWQSELSGAIAPFHARYLQLAPQLETLWTHNDWHASNLLWSDASASASVQSILDFGLSDRSSAVYDLATAIERNTIPWLAIHEGLPGAADLALVSACSTAIWRCGAFRRRSARRWRRSCRSCTWGLRSRKSITFTASRTRPTTQISPTENSCWVIALGSCSPRDVRCSSTSTSVCGRLERQH